MISKRSSTIPTMARTFVVLTMLASAAQAQRRVASSQPVPAGTTESAIVAAAEAEGRAYAAPGDTTRKCVRGWRIGPAHSGEFTIGGDISSDFPLKAGHVGKIWWAPRYNSESMPPLVVRGRNLWTPKDTIRWTSANVAYPSSGVFQARANQKHDYFFPSGFSLPTRGRWLVIATSGQNWGCFFLTVV
jgi:hypothetical protein